MCYDASRCFLILLNLMPSEEDQSRRQKHEQLIERHQQLLDKYYRIVLEEEEDVDLSHEISQIASLIASYKELVDIRKSDL